MTCTTQSFFDKKFKKLVKHIFIVHPRFVQERLGSLGAYKKHSHKFATKNALTQFIEIYKTIKKSPRFF